MIINDKQLSNIILTSFFAGIALMGLGLSIVIGDVLGIFITSISLLFLIIGWGLTLKDILKTHANKNYRME